QVFDSPKPIRLIDRLLQLGCSEPGDIVLDFFAGSGTTGHAVMKRNAEKGTDLRFLLIQLPEPVEQGDFENIAKIMEARLTRAAKIITDDHPSYGGDLGFRVFRLASSNIRAWEPDRDNLATTLEKSIDHLKGDRTEQDV